MHVDRAPATFVVCCSVPEGVRPDEFVAWAEIAVRAGVPVSWAARPADMPVVLGVLDTVAIRFDVALDLDHDALASRPALRRELAAARAVAGAVHCAVAAGSPRLEHRSLLVEQGIQTIALGGFDGVARSSRRPPPAGWACRTVVWGLWEARTVPEPRRPRLFRLLPWGVGTMATPGGLTVVHIDPATTGSRVGRVRLERLVQWIGRCTATVEATLLSDLPGLLGVAGQREAGSVLRRAA